MQYRNVSERPGTTLMLKIETERSVLQYSPWLIRYTTVSTLLMCIWVFSPRFCSLRPYLLLLLRSCRRQGILRLAIIREFWRETWRHFTRLHNASGVSDRCVVLNFFFVGEVKMFCYVLYASTFDETYASLYMLFKFIHMIKFCIC